MPHSIAVFGPWATDPGACAERDGIQKQCQEAGIPVIFNQDIDSVGIQSSPKIEALVKEHNVKVLIFTSLSTQNPAMYPIVLSSFAKLKESLKPSGVAMILITGASKEYLARRVLPEVSTIFTKILFKCEFNWQQLRELIAWACNQCLAK